MLLIGKWGIIIKKMKANNILIGGPITNKKMQNLFGIDINGKNGNYD